MTIDLQKLWRAFVARSVPVGDRIKRASIALLRAWMALLFVSAFTLLGFGAVYGALGGIVGGLLILLVMGALQYPLMRFAAKLIRMGEKDRDDTGP